MTTFDRTTATELLRDLEREAQRLERRGDLDGAVRQREEIAELEQTVPGMRRSKRRRTELSYHMDELHRVQAWWRGTCVRHRLRALFGEPAPVPAPIEPVAKVIADPGPVCCVCLGDAADLANDCKVEFRCAHSVCSTCYEQMEAHSATWALSCPLCRHDFARENVVLVIDV